MKPTRKQVEEALLKQLKDPFDPKFIKWRVGATNEKRANGQVIEKATKGIALAYIDSREVMKRLDAVCGVGGWQDRYIPVQDGFICELSIKINDEWITKSNASGYTHVEPIKGGASDALKRTASVWGIGRYLYYLPNVWVAVKPQGKSYVLAEIPELPDWAKPTSGLENWEDVAEMLADVTSGADVENMAGLILGSIDRIREATSIEELKTIVQELTSDEQTALASEIDNKTRELINGKSNTSTPSSTV